MSGVKKTIRNLDTLDYERRERLALLRLNEKEKKFCDVFVQTMDWRIALKEAGYAIQETGRHDFDETHNFAEFQRIVKRVHVAEYIMLLKESVVSRLGFSLDEIIEEYRRIAMVKMSDFYTWDSKGIKRLKPAEQLTEEQKSAVMEISETTSKAGTTVKIKLFPKQPALDRLYEILRELEEISKKEARDGKGPMVIDKRQVNVFLQDPVNRRSIEHLAEGLMGRSIFLTNKDRKREEFDRYIEQITNRVLGGDLEGTGCTGGARLLPGADAGESGSETGDGGVDGAGEAEDQLAAGVGCGPDGPGGCDEDEQEEVDPGRYGCIDGL